MDVARIVGDKPLSLNSSGCLLICLILNAEDALEPRVDLVSDDLVWPFAVGGVFSSTTPSLSGGGRRLNGLRNGAMLD